MPNKQNLETVAKIKEDLADIGALWVVDYRGLSVKEIQNLRNAIRESDACIKVYKNTLMHLALADLGLPSLDEILEGPSAFVFTGEDPVASAKALKTFAKTNKNLSVKGGMMDGMFLSAEKVEAVASLPSREELIAKLLGTIINPMGQIVRVLNGPMESFARCVSQIAEQKPAA
ncbi:MAG: 50S ribosomal protein L10 [Eggerthellaceae bacterium]|jgi:large subunit ribosomal protein L10|nr:50S ribosomal protein L10 [Eggerthellaceae bacterium]MDR2721593.1 50S ribosomal protein L10 [Coriobacteriaceae bacterium]